VAGRKEGELHEAERSQKYYYCQSSFAWPDMAWECSKRKNFYHKQAFSYIHWSASNKVSHLPSLSPVLCYNIHLFPSRRPLPPSDALDWEHLTFSFNRIDSMYLAHTKKGEPFRKGALVPYGPLPLEPASTILNYGQGIFEGLKGIVFSSFFFFVFGQQF